MIFPVFQVARIHLQEHFLRWQNRVKGSKNNVTGLALLKTALNFV